MLISLHNVKALELKVRESRAGHIQWLSLTGESEGQRFEVVLFADDAKALLLEAVRPHADLLALDHITSMVDQ